MIAQGLLVKGHNGEDFLLTTEFHASAKTRQLIMQQKINGRWERMNEIQELAFRESLIGAFVDFFVDLCRVLNSSGHRQVDEVVPIGEPTDRSRRSQPG